MSKIKKKPNKPEVKYYCFVEENDWEGETWHFYIPVKGNEAAVALLKEGIIKLEKARAALDYGECDYSFRPEIFLKKEIEIALKFDECTYMEGHQILKGMLEVPEIPDTDSAEVLSEYFHQLYKGGIRDWMKRGK